MIIYVILTVENHFYPYLCILSIFCDFVNVHYFRDFFMGFLGYQHLNHDNYYFRTVYSKKGHHYSTFIIPAFICTRFEPKTTPTHVLLSFQKPLY